MKASISDYAKLKVEGAIFQKSRSFNLRRGWYYRGEFIGYNAEEAIRRIIEIKGY